MSRRFFSLGTLSGLNANTTSTVMAACARVLSPSPTPLVSTTPIQLHKKFQPQKENFQSSKKTDTRNALATTRCTLHPKKRLQAKQITYISPKHSDHMGTLIDLGDGHKLLNKNSMMCCKPHNNGFGKTESKEEYQTRLVETAKEDCQALKKDPNIIAITRQEFAILPEDIALIKQTMQAQCIPGWENPEFHISAFGVMTCFKNRKIANAFHPDSDFAQMLPTELQSRCQKFSTSDHYSLFNMHTPHKNASDSFEKIIHAIVERKIMDIQDGKYRCADIVGDKNLEPEEQINLTRSVIEKINGKRVQNNLPPIAVLSCLVSSPDGHQQRDKNGNLFYTNVDSMHRLIISLSDTPKFEHIHETIENMNNDPAKWKYFFGVVFGGAIITTGNAITDETFEMAFARFATSLISREFQHHWLHEAILSM